MTKAILGHKKQHKNGSKKKVVVMGGGTGTFTVLSGLKKYDDLDLTAIVSMADNGGSTGILRDEYGVLPPGDIRQCLVALSESDQILRDLFNFRFEDGTFGGHSFGNLFLSAMEKMTGDFAGGLRLAEKVLGVRGRVLPVTLDKVHLVAELKNGEKIIGETAIAYSPKVSGVGIHNIYLDNEAEANADAILAIEGADIVIVGPGGLYTSLVPLFLVSGIGDALASSRAEKIYVCNLMNRRGLTDGFTVIDHLSKLEDVVGGSMDFADDRLDGIFHHVLYNTSAPASHLVKRYATEGELVRFDKQSARKYNGRATSFVGVPLLDGELAKRKRGDLLSRNLIRHNKDELARQLYRIVMSR